MMNLWVDAVVSVYKYFADPRRVTPEEYRRRLEICGDCEHLSDGSKRCRKCRCFMAVKAKVAAFDCPIGKWSMPSEKAE